jgi:galactose mutarotase-like enzyme
MPIEKANDHVVLRHSNGAFVKILFYGATAVEWKLADGTENLFLSTFVPRAPSRVNNQRSEARRLKGSSRRDSFGTPQFELCGADYRCFLYVEPLRVSDTQVFGKSTDHPTAALPQHGFARTSRWRLTGHTDNSVSFTLLQKDIDATARSQWGSDFKLVYTVEIEERSLKNIMEVHNRGSSAFECNVLLHTYLRVPVEPRPLLLANSRTSRQLTFGA